VIGLLLPAGPAAGATGNGAWQTKVLQTTASLSQRLTRLPDMRFQTTRPAHVRVIDVNDGARYQQVSGVGAAMTDSAAWLIYDELSSATRAAVMDKLFGPNGLHLGFLRVPIAASDFTAGRQPYTYDEMPAGQSDPSLKHFSIAHDKQYILPALRMALSRNSRIKIVANPWTAPRWMKANRAFDDSRFLGTLLPSAYQPFAAYVVRFLKAYAGQGVPVAGVTPENEPRSPAPFPAMSFSAANESRWITDDLVPALHAAGLSTEVYGGDVAWGSGSYPRALVSSAAAGSLAGIAWHCYSDIPTVMGAMHALAPALDQVVNECANEITPYPVAEILIGALRNWASSVSLWNLALDPSGGPVQAPNFGCGGCRGVVTIDPGTHAVRYGLSYYQLGQVGRFVQPGARRTGSPQFVRYFVNNSKGTYGVSSGLDDATFLNPDGSEVLVAYNNSSAASRFAIHWNKRFLPYTLPARAMVTFVWNRGGHPAGGSLPSTGGVQSGGVPASQ
jgi:glucosylceramidase